MIFFNPSFVWYIPSADRESTGSSLTSCDVVSGTLVALAPVITTNERAGLLKLFSSNTNRLSDVLYRVLPKQKATDVVAETKNIKSKLERVIGFWNSTSHQQELIR